MASRESPNSPAVPTISRGGTGGPHCTLLEETIQYPPIYGKYPTASHKDLVLQQKTSGESTRQSYLRTPRHLQSVAHRSWEGLRVHLLLRGGKLCIFPLKQPHVETSGVKKGEGRAECRAAAQTPELQSPPGSLCLQSRMADLISGSAMGRQWVNRDAAH